ncbi:hypothetical protein NY99_21375 [Xanthomonas phaseoli pv. phaseoli]|uniref:hypothetical protein n=1 Tax=Xanthomonas phaseoli TaxID=1985254 RepID=UPI0005384A9F|nr:hypothetical protein [Xanthomonas phaseoli]KGU50819.1 hypothetical protein NY99_21375 [Xanthomonas phaseoli pv. phaseoli]KHF47620.1 hypothetical protein QQ30_15360 [Xanthomonas phaseoli pv. phaseoli]KHS05380.1 hypothetical protein RM61_21720 [Xanthomonas phaseoli pv. phaseoli]KHS22357.1 hypothetical protein RM60_20950 [Xanthomonas phaseoli pv. phaseoli]
MGVLESFDRSHAPWTFIQPVRAADHLDAGDRVLLDQAWAAACRADHWMSARTLDAGAAAAEHALSKRVAWLSPLACRQLARAASYAWR